MLDKLLFLVALAGTAVVYADVLVRDGMLLAPVQRWLREWSHPKDIDLDTWWLSKMLWFCFACVAGQWGFWGYLIRYHASYAQGWRTALLHTLPEHIAFTAFTIIAAIIISKWTE